MPGWLLTGLMEAAVWITAVFVAGYLISELWTSPQTRRSRGKYARFVRHRSGVNLYESPVPPVSQPTVRCLFGHDVNPNEATWTADHGWLCAVCEENERAGSEWMPKDAA